MTGKGISSPPQTLVWEDVIRFKRSFVDDVPASNERSFLEAGIRTIQERAHFVDPASLEVGDETLVGRHLVISAGARHAPIAIPGEEHLTASYGVPSTSSSYRAESPSYGHRAGQHATCG